MAIIVSPEEKVYRAKVAEHYSELPIRERRPYAESLGLSRATLCYWSKTYGKYATMPKPDPHGKNPEKAAKMAEREARAERREARIHKALPPQPASLPWEVEDFALLNSMRRISVSVKDRREVHEPRIITTLAEFKAGQPVPRAVNDLARQALAVLDEWGYKQPTEIEMGKYIKRLWV